MTLALPRPVAIRVVDRRLRDAESLGQVGEGRAFRGVPWRSTDGTRRVLGADGGNLFGGQYRSRVALPFHGSRPALGDSICNVRGVGSEEQMIRTYARAVVAGVEYVSADRDGAIRESPRDSMREGGNATHLETTVTAGVPHRGPCPAAARSLDPPPEPNFDGLCLHDQRITQ